MSKALVAALIVLTSALTVLIPTCSSSSGWSITVQTDKPYYHIGDTVYVSGNLTYNGWPQQSVQVSISVKSSGSATPYYSGAATTDEGGEYNLSFTLGINAELGAYTVSAIAEEYTNQTALQVTDAIYIKANGGVEPANAPININGDIYTLTDNVTANSTGGIVIERNNTILDGAGFTLTGKNLVDSNGILLTQVSSVTVKNISVGSFHDGIHEDSCSNCQIMETSLSSNSNGVFFQYSKLNTIEGNNITQNALAGIWLDMSQNNTISKNRLANNTIASNLVGGINLLDFSSYNNIVENNFANNTYYGIYIQNSFSNNILHNNLYNSTHLAYVDGNTSSNVWDDGYPSGGNYWSNYSGVDQKHGQSQDQFGSDGIGDTPYTIDTSNVDHYPLMNPFPAASAPSIPTASFTHYPDFPIAKQEPVVFNATDSQCPNGTLTNYLWNFGDGTYGQDAATLHTYESYGNYTVTLTVISDTRSSNDQHKSVTIRESPLANFTTEPSSPPVGQPIILNASASMSLGGTITTYAWDFGDGHLTSTADPVTTHTYTFPGTYNITLTVLDSEDLNSSLSQIVPAKVPTFVAISTSPSTAYAGFQASVNGTLYDVYGNGLENEQVALYYNLQGTTTWSPLGSGLTDSLGHYYVQWTPSATGYFTIKVEWAGNGTHYGASNNVTLSVLPYQNQQILSVESNSTVSALAFNTTSSELSFTVTGPSGTMGSAKVTVAKSFVTNITNTKMYIDGNQIEYSIASSGDSWILTCTYSQSTHKVTVDLQADLTPPITTDDYDGLWHNVDFTISLNATDQESGVLETFYRINHGSTLNITANGQPLIAAESANNTLEYWSVDKAGNEEDHQVLTGIKLDKTKPTGSIHINNGVAYTNSTSATLSLTASDNVSGVAQMRFSNDNASWTSWETYNASKAWSLTLGDGTKTVYCQFRDNAGLTSSVCTDNIVLDTSDPIIETISRMPKGDIQPDQSVIISVNASDSLSGIKSVRITYSWLALWVNMPMTLNSSTDLYEFSIFGQPADTVVKYWITAYDRAGNSATNDNAGQYYVYAVIPEFPTTSVVMLFMMATLLAAIAYRREHRESK
jgi:parallel beta-helix repeat protein